MNTIEQQMLIYYNSNKLKPHFYQFFLLNLICSFYRFKQTNFRQKLLIAQINDLMNPSSKAKSMIHNFKARQQQKTIQQALVFLKLKDSYCPTKSALLFSKKKQKNVDSTLQRDGPPNFRQLTPIKSDGIIINGWLKGQKLKYKSTTSFNNYIRHSSASLSTQINSYYKKSRKIEENQRRNGSKSLFNLDQHNHKASIQKIIAIKDNVMKQRELNPFVFKLKGVDLPQMTKIFSQTIAKMNVNGLVVKSGAFQNCINDSQVQYIAMDENSFTKTSKNLKDTTEMNILDKRNEVIKFKKHMDEIHTNKNHQLNHDKLSSLSLKKKKSLSITLKVTKNGKNPRLTRSKSIKKEIELQQFGNKISKVIKNEYFSHTFTSMNDFKHKNQQRPKFKLQACDL